MQEIRNSIAHTLELRLSRTNPSIWHFSCEYLTHWGRVTDICIGNVTIIGPDNGLLPGRRQAIIWTNAGILLIGPLETNFSEIFIKIHIFSFNKIHLKMTSGKWRPFYLGLNELREHWLSYDGTTLHKVTQTVWSHEVIMYDYQLKKLLILEIANTMLALCICYTWWGF